LKIKKVEQGEGEVKEEDRQGGGEEEITKVEEEVKEPENAEAPQA